MSKKEALEEALNVWFTLPINRKRLHSIYKLMDLDRCPLCEYVRAVSCKEVIEYPKDLCCNCPVYGWDEYYNCLLSKDHPMYKWGVYDDYDATYNRKEAALLAMDVCLDIKKTLDRMNNE